MNLINYYKFLPVLIRKWMDWKNIFWRLKYKKNYCHIVQLAKIVFKNLQYVASNPFTINRVTTALLNSADSSYQMSSADPGIHHIYIYMYTGTTQRRRHTSGEVINAAAVSWWHWATVACAIVISTTRFDWTK